MANVTAKSVIVAGIEAGKSVKFILGQVAKKCPGSKADASHVRFYANALVKAEKLKTSVAAEKYGCGARGRKAEGASIVKKPASKKPSVKKKVVQKKGASKKSGGNAEKNAPRKASKKRKATSKN